MARTSPFQTNKARQILAGFSFVIFWLFSDKIKRWFSVLRGPLIILKMLEN